MKQAVYIVSTARTPFLKARGKPGTFRASDLAVFAGRHLLAQLPIPPEAVDEVVLGCVNPRENEANIARLTALRLGCGEQTPAWTVQRNCGSGMQALDSAMQSIQCGRADLVLAGGCEAMSHAPLVYNRKMTEWFAMLQRAKSLPDKLRVMTKLKISALFHPVVALIAGLTDPLSGLSMGQTAENLAYRFNITRKAMDAFAVQSHQRVLAAQQGGKFADLAVLIDHNSHINDHDDGVRTDTTIEALDRLKPFFDRRFGMVTAGNSSQISDGAAFILLASEAAITKYELPVLARVADVQWAALDPDSMGLGPVFAATPLLQRNKLQLDDIDYWEINEAFAAQLLACLRAWQCDDFCRQQLGLSQAAGAVSMARLNVDGGAIALGHPVGASGARIVAQLAHTLQRNQAKRGIASLCIGGGQGGAMLLESV